MNENTALHDEKDVRRYSIAQLREICQKTSSNPAREGISGRVVRFFSIFATMLFLRTRLSPNHVTVLSVVVFFIGVWMFFVGTYETDIIGSLVIFLSVILDGSDGELARFRKTAGRLGSNYVEPISHDIQYGISFLMLGAALAIRNETPVFYLLGGVASVAKLLYRLLESRFWHFYHAGITKDEIGSIKQAYESLPLLERLASWIRRHIYSSTGFSISCIVFSIFGRLEVLLWFWAIGASIFCILLAGKQFWRIARDNKF
ncbi:MAG: hypothetical protein NUV98_06550 [Candidatus Roizmanbacteria bacterium]|nr:hypothetical protein [Candidatus Roizmanbacteria bacterium]